MAETYVSQQVWQMLQMFLCGWVMLFSVHEKNMLMQVGRWKYRQRMVGDFLFCLLWAVLLWLILMAVSGGLVRNYIVMGWLSGACVYHVLCRRYLERLCRVIAKTIVFIWRWLWRILWMPWRVICRFVITPCMTLLHKWISKFFEKVLPKKQEIDMGEDNITRYGEIFEDDYEK